MTIGSTNDFALFSISKIEKDVIKNNYTEDWFFDFQFSDIDLPYDWNQDIFIDILKSKFNTLYVKIDKLDYKYRCVGKVKVN